MMVGSVSGPALGEHIIELMEGSEADKVRSLFRWYHRHLRAVAHHLLASVRHDIAGPGSVYSFHPESRDQELHKEPPRPKICLGHVQSSSHLRSLHLPQCIPLCKFSFPQTA